jgi:predicted ATP-grasp superfamily ATP-dependent carboligase
MELVERQYGVSMFAMHAAACDTGTLPAFDLDRARAGAGAYGKAIVFAQRDIVVDDTHAWLADSDVRDVPKAGEHIAAGSPICTVFASGADASTCHANLVARAERIYALVDSDASNAR